MRRRPLFFNKQKLRKEYDENLVQLIKQTKQELENLQQIEDLVDDFNLDTMVQKKIAESKYFYLFKEARIRRVQIR
ncbi:YaaL family protein [Kurthia gibsonii]|uniref:YaaL family protein n=1 Tax=Kurthia gibsonii TaxID=33946 RepID=UPI003F1F5F18